MKCFVNMEVVGVKNQSFIKPLLFLSLLFLVQISFGQVGHPESKDGFNIKQAYADAATKGIIASDVEGYVQTLHNEYLSHLAHNHSVGANQNGSAGRPSSPFPTPQNSYCPNAGFEQLDFSNWVGGYGTVASGSMGAPYPTYTQTNPVFSSPAGNNAPLASVNYHTIMTTPPINNVYPNCVGYDSIACKTVGAQVISEIPFLNPNGGGASSMRLNGTNAANRGCSASYSMTLNPNNKNFSVSYALLFYDGSHAAYDQPYFSVKITDQNGNPVPGCSVYTVTCDANLTNTASPSYDPTWENSVVWPGVMYRKWTTSSFDFTNYPSITSVNVELYMGTCAQGGHFSYAYVDADCGQGGAVSSFCAGSNTSIINAPSGYTTYQWTGPSGPVAISNGGNTATATITPVMAGQVFTCNVTAQNGCLSSFQTTVSVTTVSVTGVSSSPSCLNGASGTTNVSATGSSLGYSYQWLNSSGGVVGTNQSAIGLAPGTYSVIVSSPMCGSATSTVDVGIAPPNFYSLSAPYCGTTAWITQSGGTGYQWYTASPLAMIPGANTSSLTVTSPVNGAEYLLSYTTAGGCKDSIKFVLNQTPGGSVYVSNIKSICPGNSNSYAVVNLQTSAPPVYSYTVTGPSGYNSTLNGTTAIKDSVINLSIGTYTADIFDGQCLYNTTFTVNPFVYNYTVTPNTSTVCAASGTLLAVDFGNITSSSCGLSTTGGCTSPNQVTIGTGTNLNTTFSYPSVYGHYYRNARHQLLYTASELAAAGVLPGKISSVSFNVSSIPTGYIGTLPGVQISLKCTSAAVLNAFDNTGLVQVYNASSFTPVVGWNVHSFPTAYDWDGTSNIIVDICYTLNTSVSWTSNVIMPYSITPVNQCVYASDDNNPLCGTVPGFANATTSRPNLKFENCGGFNPAMFSYSWTPTTGLSSSSSYTTIAQPTVATVYTISVEPTGQTNCAITQTASVYYINPVTPTITAVAPLCNTASTISLVASPLGGVWTGTGVTTAGVLTPSLATIGSNSYTYSIGAGNCAGTNATTISVEQFVPSTITGSIVPQCVTNTTVNLVPLPTFTTGVWNGTGVTGAAFDPALAGPGTYTLSYTTNSSPTPSLCPSTSTLTVSVSTVAQPVITPAGPYCDNFAAQNMTVSPLGGVWTSTTAATSITAGGVFSPATSQLGSNKIIYTLVNGPCTKKDSILVNVVHFVPATITGTVGPNCIYDVATDLQTIVQFPGGVWSGTGVNSGTFTPATAGPGSYTLTYHTDPAPSGLCPDTKTITILVNNKPNVNALSDKIDGCNPTNVSFYTTSVNTGSGSWNFGDGSTASSGLTTSHTYTLPGVYMAVFTYTDAIGCIDTTSIPTAVTIYSVPVASFEPSVLETTVVDAQIDFTNQSTVLANNTYVWNLGGLQTDNKVNSSYLFTISGDYVITLTATNPEGCVDDTSIVVQVKPDVVLYVPNAFTPGNGDGLNDVLQIFLPPTGVDYSTFSLMIFNRWGDVVYQTNDVNKFWNGAKNNSGPLLKQDTYVWKIIFKDEQRKTYQRMGHIMLMGK